MALLTAVINTSSNAAAPGVQLVAASTGKRVRLTSCLLIANGTVNVTWYGSGGVALSGPLPLAANIGFTLPVGPQLPHGQAGYLETLYGEGLYLFLGATVQVSGMLTYVLTL
jgi:hypothetical protein